MKKPILTTIPNLLSVSDNGLGYHNIKIPVFQREYSWDLVNAQKLLNDLDNDKDKRHFFGVIIGKISNGQLLVIDGQQRIITTSLLLKSKNEEDIFAKYLSPVNDQFVVIPSSLDSESYRKIMNDEKDESDSLMSKVYEDFQSDNSLSTNELNDCLGKLEVVFIELEEGIDDANEIFETINHDGVNLTLADLIRNYLLMELPNQDDLFKQIWKPMINDFRKYYPNDANNKFNDFITRYIEYKVSEKIRGDAYAIFKKLSPIEKKENTIIDLRIKSSYYHVYNGASKEIITELTMADGKYISKEHNLDLEITQPIKRLNMLRIAQAFSPLIPLFDKNLEEISPVCDLFCSFIIRSQVCSGKTGSFTSIFPQLCVESRLSYSDMAKFLREKQSFPHDSDFKTALEQPLYNKARVNVKYILEMLESNNLDPKREAIIDGNYSVEHIMPQTIDPDSKSKEHSKWAKSWIEMLGDDWFDAHNNLCNTLGNLTLTTYNPEYSNRPFSDKLELEQGKYNIGINKSNFAELNEDVRFKDKWNGASIMSRTKRLAKKAVGIWPFPGFGIDEE